jgi:signal transduction histidine kinase
MIEPGLLKVFRGYAFLRLALGVLVLIAQVVFPDKGVSINAGSTASGAIFNQRVDMVQRESGLVLVSVLLLMVLLILYLYSPRLQRRLGNLYVPAAIAIASLTLFLEEYLFTPRAAIWQADSFFFILLIFVSWQYTMRAVVLYSAATALTDYVLNTVFRPTIFFFAVPPSPSISMQPLAVAVFLGRQTGRLLSFIIVGFVITSLVSAQRKQRQELAQANQQLLEHSVTLEQLATSRERNRLSRELHDTLAHTLSGLSVQLDALQTTWKQMPAKAGKMVEDMLGITRRGLEETRRTVKDLRATPLEELGLAQAVRALAEDASRRNNFHLELQIPRRLPEFPPEVEHCFYRVAQEGLENIARHANAKTAWLTLTARKTSLELTLRDDGAGFYPAQVNAQERFGLRLMRERAELIGASFEIGGRPGAGTVLSLRYEP